MVLAIIGSRDFNDYEQLSYFIRKNVKVDNITEIVSGGARGADALAEKFAMEYHIPTTIFKPNWQKFGRPAGMIRNKDIIEKSEVVFAFWDGISKGTANSLKLAEKAKKSIYIYQYEVN